MARATYVVRPVNGVMTLIPKHEAPALEVARSHSLPTPMLALDAMPATEHPLDGSVHESKSGFRAITKAHGYTEMGNDPARMRQREKPEPDRASIKDAVQKSLARVKRGETV